MPEKRIETRNAGMCSHGNFPNTCEKCKAQHPEELILTADEVANVSWQDVYPVSARNNDQEIHVLGTVHIDAKDAQQAGFIKQQIDKTLQEIDPELVLVEGAADAVAQSIINGDFPEISQVASGQRDEAVISRFQEQVYVAMKALEAGKRVESWDLSPGEELIASFERATEEQRATLTEYYAYIGALKMLEMGQRPSAEGIIRLIVDNFRISEEQLRAAGVAEEKLRSAVPKAIEDISLNEARAKVDPTGTEPTNAVLRNLNTLRDKHAVEIMHTAKKQGVKRIFVVAGGSHAVAWEPAIMQMYS